MRFAFGGMLFLIAVGLQLWLIRVFSEMHDEVNRALPDELQEPQIGPGWYRGIVIRRHRELFPGSQTRKKL